MPDDRQAPAHPPNDTRLRRLPSFLRDLLQGREYLQDVVGNIGWHTADHLGRAAVGLLIGAWTARYLGPQDFGGLSYALAFVALFSSFATLGLDDIVVRELVRDAVRRHETLGTAFLLKLLGGALSFLAATAGIFLLRPSDQLSHWLVAIIAAGSVFQAFQAIEFWFHSQVQAKYAVLAKSTAFLLCAVIKIALILSQAPLIAFAWVAMLEVLSGAIGLVIVYHAQGHRLKRWRIRREAVRKLLADCWPLFLSCLVIVAYLRIDQVMLGEMAGSRAVGVYSVAVRLAEVWLFISSAVYWSVLPSLVQAKAADEALFYCRLQKYYNLMALAGYAVALPTTFLAGWLIRVCFGAPYAEAAPMLAVLIWANLFIYLDAARSAFFNVMNWYKFYFVTLALGALLNVGLNLYLIPRYGGLGAAVASCFSYWFAAHGSCFLFRPLRRTGMMLTKAMLLPKAW